MRIWSNMAGFTGIITSCALCSVSDLWKLLFCLLAPVALANFLYEYTDSQCTGELEDFDWRNN